MMKAKYKELFRYISDTDESCASDILYSLELVKTSLNGTLKRIKEEIQAAANENSFDGVSQIAGYCKQITEINQELEEMILALHFEPSEGTAAATLAEEKTEDEKDIAHPVDYTAFDVSRTEPHTLDEDFEHKKVCGLRITGVEMPVENWQDAIVKLCAYLNRVDDTILKTFVGDSMFRGKKNKYFMLQSVPKRNKRIPGTNIYVWTNNSANRIITIIKDVLERYNIPADEVVIYLRRDLTELHK